jgi:hypothetical protein
VDGEENVEHEEEGVRDDDDKEEEEDVLDENEEKEGQGTSLQTLNMVGNVEKNISDIHSERFVE